MPWRNEVPKPTVKLHLSVRESHDTMLRKVAKRVRAKTGKTVTVACIIDHLLKSADVPELVSAIAKEAK